MTTAPLPASTPVADLRLLMLSSQRFRQAMADHFDLSLSEVVALGHLADSSGSLTPRDLAERMLLRSGTLTAIIDRLVAADFVKRTPNPRDRRSALVGLTPAGRRVVRFVDRRLERALASADDGAASGGVALAPLAAALDHETERIAARFTG